MPSQAYRDAAYPEATGEAFIMLLVLENDELEAPIFLTDAGGAWSETEQAYGITVGANFYISAPIEIIPPGQSDEEPEGKIRVPNVDQRIGEGLDSITTPLVATVTAVLESDTSIVVGGPHELLKVQNVRGDALVIEGDLTRPFLVQEYWPREWMRPAKFRAAFRA